MIFIEGLVFGIVVCAPLGPVFAASVRYGLQGGFPCALRVQIGSLVGDTFYAGAGLALVATAGGNLVLSSSVSLLSMIVLFYLSASSFRDAFRSPRKVYRLKYFESPLLAGAAVSFLSFDSLALWASILKSYSDPANGLYLDVFFEFFVGFLCAAFIWAISTSLLIHFGFRSSNPYLTRLANALCGVVLAYFAIQLAWRAVL